MLLTRPRIDALSRISRFAGWTSRPYGVLEHSLIGAKLLAESNYSRDAQRAFLLHDLHETAFGGDITTPIKVAYLSDQYHVDVAVWDSNLSAETGVPPCFEVVHRIDAVMLAAESRTVFTGNWKAPIPDGCADAVKRAQALIIYNFYQRDQGVEAFWQMWAGE